MLAKVREPLISVFTAQAAGSADDRCGAGGLSGASESDMSERIMWSVLHLSSDETGDRRER